MIRVSFGNVYDVIVDLRISSDTFGKYFGLEISAENKKQLIIPKGFAHGFLVLSEYAEFQYKTSDYYIQNLKSFYYGIVKNLTLIGLLKIQY